MDYDFWEPLAPDEIAAMFGNATFPWWIGGGWAIDLFLGRQTRAHEDTDVQVLHRDSLAAQTLLQGWELFAADPPGTLRAWDGGEKLAPAIHDVWARRGPDRPWEFQLMLADAEDDTWVYRRDRRIRRLLKDIGLRDEAGRPYLAPKIQLLFKSKGSRPKDEGDLVAALPLLSDERRRWLREAITITQPDHPWLQRL